MPENENNDGVMNAEVTNLPEGDADTQGTESGNKTEGGEDGTEGGETGNGEDGTADGETGNGEDGTEDGETGNGEDGTEDGESVGDIDLDGDMSVGSDMLSSIGGMDNMIGGMDGMMGGDMGAETGVKDPILSNVPFVAGTISAALVVGIVLGILLGKKRIKKGFDSYEN